MELDALYTSTPGGIAPWRNVRWDGRMELDRWDAIIVGGGGAGLSAALTLVRARRRVLVIDTGAPRNGVAAHMHGVLGRDGWSPLALVEAGRDEVRSYGGTVIEADAQQAEVAEGGFVVTINGGERHFGRRLVVATGLRDVLPDIPGLAQHWGPGPSCAPTATAGRRVIAASPCSRPSR